MNLTRIISTEVWTPGRRRALRDMIPELRSKRTAVPAARTSRAVGGAVPTPLAPGARTSPPRRARRATRRGERRPLTCTGAPVVGLAHPLVALAQGPEVHAGLAHVTDADPAVAPAAAVAQSAPWGLPGRPAPALRLGPGEPARGARASSAGATNHSGATVKPRHCPFCSEPTLPPRVHPDPRSQTETCNPVDRKPGTPRFSGDQADTTHGPSLKKWPRRKMSKWWPAHLRTGPSSRWIRWSGPASWRFASESYMHT